MGRVGEGGGGGVAPIFTLLPTLLVEENDDGQPSGRCRWSSFFVRRVGCYR